MELTTKEAIFYLLEEKDMSKYGIAKALGVQPIMIDHYLNNSRMKEDKALMMQDLFGITITDVYNPSKTLLERMKNDTKTVSD